MESQPNKADEIVAEAVGWKSKSAGAILTATIVHTPSEEYLSVPTFP